jgi:nicotinamide-nucleotide amidase
MRIEILCTGDEVLTGKIVNSNFSWMSQRLEDSGLSVIWGTTVGDDREKLLTAFHLAASRADAVIVNGGLGPTVDDLSQEIAAQAAGVALVLHEEWLAKMSEFFARRSRTMPENNRKQAMLPATAEMLDNPIGTACGFAVDIGKARFFFTPGVPREMRRMVDEQIIPRLLASAGRPGIIRLKRFHSYGLGESHVDSLLTGVESLAPDVKLGFRAHYPQLETKLTIRGTDEADIAAKLAPVQAEIRTRLGNFILAEDDATLESVILAALAARNETLAIAETFTGGQIAGRLAPRPDAAGIFRYAVVTPTPTTSAEALRAHASIGLAVNITLDEGADRIDLGGAIDITIATSAETITRHARILGGRDWVRLGAAEMALDCLRRFLQGLPVDERIDFEKR